MSALGEKEYALINHSLVLARTGNILTYIQVTLKISLRYYNNCWQQQEEAKAAEPQFSFMFGGFFCFGLFCFIFPFTCFKGSLSLTEIQPIQYIIPFFFPIHKTLVKVSVTFTYTITIDRVVKYFALLTFDFLMSSFY